MYSYLKAGALGLGLALVLALPGAAWADKIKHPTAVFSGLDKITGRIKSFEVAMDETVQFGTLQITPRVCFSRPTTEAPQTDVFAEVDEVEPDKSLVRSSTKRQRWPTFPTIPPDPPIQTRRRRLPSTRRRRRPRRKSRENPSRLSPSMSRTRRST